MVVAENDTVEFVTLLFFCSFRMIVCLCVDTELSRAQFLLNKTSTYQLGKIDAFQQNYSVEKKKKWKILSGYND